MKDKFNQEECYMVVPIKSVNRAKILEYAKLSNDFAQIGYLPQFSFPQTFLPEEFITEDPFLNALRTELNVPSRGPACGFRILKMKPNCFYPFHIDVARPVSINMFLSGGLDNKTYFRASKVHDLLFNIIPLEYELDTYYLLNTQAYHGAISGPDDRYILSITPEFEPAIKGDPMVVFNKYCNWIRSKYINNFT
jgi:hypothetical protein